MSEAKRDLSIWLPVRTIERVERAKGYYSTSRWIWKAIEKELEEQEREKIAV